METGGAVETSYEHDDGEECQSKLASLYEFHQDSPQPAGEDNEAAGEIERIEGDGAEVEDDRPAQVVGKVRRKFMTASLVSRSDGRQLIRACRPCDAVYERGVPASSFSMLASVIAVRCASA